MTLAPFAVNALLAGALSSGLCAQDPSPQLHEFSELGGSSLETLARFVEAFVEPPLADDEEVVALGTRWLAVVGRREQHAWIETLRDTALTHADGVTHLRGGIYRLSELQYQREIAPALRGAEAAEDTAPVVVLDAGPGTDALLQSLRGSKGVEELQMPRVSVNPLQRAQLSTSKTTSYVRDYELKVSQDAFMADPVVDVVKEGLMLEALVVPFAQTTALTVDVQWGDLMEPIPTFSTSLGEGTAPVTIQLPQVQETRIEAALELTPQRMAVLSLPPLFGKRYVVTLEVVPGETADAPQRRPKKDDR